MRAQLLDAPGPTDLLEVVERLTLLQVDPTAAIAPNADLVAWSRLGSSYRPEHLKRALEEDRTLFEFNALIRPMGDLGLYLAGAGGGAAQGKRGRVAPRQRPLPARYPRRLLSAWARSRPATSRTRASVPWVSTGWTTIATSRRCSSSCIARRSRDRRSRSAAALGPGRARLSRDVAGARARRREGSGTSAGSPARHRPGGRGGRCPASLSTSAMRASRPSSRAAGPWRVDPATS